MAHGEARAGRTCQGSSDRSPSELSGGQQQRVAVARALVLEPQVLLFDEPLSNLDAKLRRRVREDIRELQQSLNLTVAYVTHDQEEALAVSDHIIVMSNARIAQTGSPRELYEEPADLFVADFIGDANILTGVLGEQEGNLCTCADRRVERPPPSSGRARRFGETGGAAGCNRVERGRSLGHFHPRNGHQGVLSGNPDGIRGRKPGGQSVRRAIWQP